MKNKQNIMKLAAVLIATFVAGEAHAAVQGSLGATSTGSVDILVKKPARVRISNLQDLTVNQWVDGDGPVQLTNDVCVYSTRPNGGYKITAHGDGTGNAFTIKDAANDIMPYTVAWNSAGVGALSNTGAALTTGTQSAALTHAATDSSTCAGATPGATARLIVNIAEASMVAATDGDYAGTLTMLVTPN
jgi:hypothetical protein